jgi:hypothetical protein
LVHEFDHAEKRPPVGFAVATSDVDGIIRPCISAPVPSRMTLALPLPRRGVLQTRVAIVPRTARATPVRLRIGVSDDRIYETVTEQTVEQTAGAWISLRADLSPYAGWKWSLFYRPEGITWRVVLAADATNSAPATVLWGAPEIVTDSLSAREYAARRQRLR